MCEPATDLERVVATHGGVSLAEIVGHHRVRDEVRLAASEDGAHGVEQVVVRRALRVDPQGQVRHDLQQFALEAQHGTPDAAVVRAEVGVRERVGEHPVEADPEQPQAPVQLLVADTVEVRREQRVEIAQVHGIAGDRRHVRVENQQERQGLVEVARRRQFQERRAVAQRDGVVRQDVPGPIRRIALVHVADDPLVERLRARVRNQRWVKGILGETRPAVARAGGR